jgi:catechol 2,3-dioxygenase-like lactoylglutathione lyase family enzyme
MLKIIDSFATLPAQDLQRARKFYEQKLGLTPLMVTPDGGAVYQTGANTAFSVFPSTGKASGDHTQITLRVGDVGATVAELKKSGVKFEEYDFPGFKTDNGIAGEGENQAAWFKDTEGNLLVLVQFTAAQEAAAASARGTATNGS